MELVKREDRYDLYADDGSKIASTSPNTMKKLSLKNCQAIEQDSPLQEYVLEVNGEGWDDHLYRGSRKQTEWDIEIEMECVMGCQNLILNGENSVCCGDKKPRLDADGCLILKTFKSE
jgi:hypothetical protein